jgi:hypothetical protein
MKLRATWRQVPNPQVRVQAQVHENGTRVLLEYKYMYQVLHHCKLNTVCLLLPLVLSLH